MQDKVEDHFDRNMLLIQSCVQSFNNQNAQEIHVNVNRVTESLHHTTVDVKAKLRVGNELHVN